MGTWNFVEGEGILLAQLELSLDSIQDIVISNLPEVKDPLVGLQERSSPLRLPSPPLPVAFHGFSSGCILCIPDLTLPTFVGEKKTTVRE